MKNKLLYLLFLIATSILFAQDKRHLTFKGVPINGSLKSFVTELQKTGLKYVSTLDGNAQFEGEFAGYSNCTVYAISKNDLVFKVGVLFPDQDSWTLLSNNYFNIKRLLTEKYGDPIIVKEEFENSYANDNNSKMNQVKFDNCRYYSSFMTLDGYIELSISNIGVSRCFVRLIYEDKINSDTKEQQIKDDL